MHVIKKQNRINKLIMKSNHPLCTYSLELEGEPFLNVPLFQFYN